MQVAFGAKLRTAGFVQAANVDTTDQVLIEIHSKSMSIRHEDVAHKPERNIAEEEEEEEFYKLLPANKADHLCQSWQYVIHPCDLDSL